VRTGGEQPPRASLVPAAAGDPAIVVAWTEKGVAGTRIVSSRSSDGGRTFGAGAILPGSDAAGNRGWESIATDPTGQVDAIWLDHRDAAMSGAPDMSHHMEHMTPGQMQTDSVAKAQLSKLYFAGLGGAAQGRPIAAGVCYCCKTALTVGADGAIYAAWRHVYAGNVRDIAFTMSKDGGKTFMPPVRVSEDKWALDGCPENGPAIAVDAKRAIHLAWPTFVPGQAKDAGNLALFYATSRDGRTFTARQAVPTAGTPRHVQMALAGDGAVALVWDEGDANGHRVAIGRGVIAPSGRVRFARQVVTALGTASYPALAPVPDGFLIAATTNGSGTDSTIRVTHAGPR
jgi:hypothetical protein